MSRKKTQSKHMLQKEEAFFQILLVFFAAVFFLKLLFGVISDARSLLVSAFFSLFCVLIVVAAMLRNQMGFAVMVKKNASFNLNKIELVIVAGVSFIVVITTGVFLFSLMHTFFFHRLSPPGIGAAWISACVSGVYCAGIVWLKEIYGIRDTRDMANIMFLSNVDFIVSFIVVIVIVFARMGFYALDYGAAIIEALFIMGYSFYFLSHSLKGLMDASCDAKTLVNITRYIKKADPNMHIKDLKVNYSGKVYEIIVMVGLSHNTKIYEVEKIIEKIRCALRAHFQLPHEIYVGVKAK